MATRTSNLLLRLAAALALITAVGLSSGSTAFAQEDMTMQSTTQNTGFGVGVESLLSGPSGPALVYQAANYHAEGIIGVFDRVNTSILLAGRFYYQIHNGDLSDFSLGGGIGLLNFDRNGGGGGGNENETDLHVELGAKIRVFLAPNVAISTSLGLAIIADDADDTAIIAGRLQGSMGITYFFF